MSPVPALIARLSEAGYSIVVKDGVPKLVPQPGRESKLNGVLREEVKANREAILEWYRPSPDPFHESPLPGPQAASQPDPSRWIRCDECRCEVNVTQFQSMTAGMQLFMCGKRNCPIRSKC